MSHLELKRKFVDKLELLYRNFGNEWDIKEIISNDKQIEILIKFLPELEEKGVLKLKKDKTSFIILDLPSNHRELFLF